MTSTTQAKVPFVLTGMARSGTTYFGDLAGRYLDIGAVNEGTFEFWLSEQDFSPSALRDDATFHNLLNRFADHLYFRFLYKNEFNVDQVASDLLPLIEERSAPGLAEAALKLAARWRRSRLGHEDPVFMYKLQNIVDMYPGCKMIQIVRDPRDVTASVLQFPWGPNNAVVAAHDWNRLISKARAIGAKLGADRYLEFRYEDLLTKPAETMSALLKFVTGSVDSAKVAEFERETASNPLRRNFGNWKTGLTTQQIQLVEAAAQEQMKEFGYAPEYPERGISTARLKIWRLHHRAVQVRNILFGKLHINGLGKIDPPSALRGPKRLQEATTRS